MKKIIKKDIVLVEEVVGLEGEVAASPRWRGVSFQWVPKTIIPMVYDSVCRDNRKFMMERHIYNVEFFKFIVELFENVEIEEDNEKLTVENKELY